MLFSKVYWVLKKFFLKISVKRREKTSAGASFWMAYNYAFLKRHSGQGVFMPMLRNNYRNIYFAVFKYMDEKFGSLLFRSTRSQIFLKIGVFQKTAIFTQKYLCWNLFLKKLKTWSPATYLKEIQNRFYPVNIERFLKAPFLFNTSGGCFLLFIANICCFKFQINNPANIYLFSANNRNNIKSCEIC